MCRNKRQHDLAAVILHVCNMPGTAGPAIASSTLLQRSYSEPSFNQASKGPCSSSFCTLPVAFSGISFMPSVFRFAAPASTYAWPSCSARRTLSPATVLPLKSLSTAYGSWPSSGCETASTATYCSSASERYPKGPCITTHLCTCV